MQPRTVEVWAIGTRVKLGDGEVPGIITAVSLRQDLKVSYEVTWWDNRSRHVEWFGSIEIRQIDQIPQTKIGFFGTKDKD